MHGTDDGRGILFPDRLPTFTRVPAPEALTDRIRWFWIPRWDLPAGRVSRQRLLPFPASNLVVQLDGVTLAGPTTGASHRDLSGRGWAVGTSLRPAGIAALHPAPGRIRDIEVPFPAADLHTVVTAAMEPAALEAEGDSAITGAVEAFAAWAADRIGPPDESGLLANTMEQLVADDRSIVRVDQLAERLSASVRTVQRLARRYVGLPPLSMIRRYRLQEAAQRLRDDPALTVGRIAADLGYADHAHLTADFRRVLGSTPTSYRRDQPTPGQSPEVE